jgi:hypothetical protein
MIAHPFAVRDRVSIGKVQQRAHEFPRLAELVREQVDQMQAGARVHRDTGPRLLVLLGESGARTGSLLSKLESAIRLFDVVQPAGWDRFCHQIGRAREQSHFLSMSAELVIARFFQKLGLPVLEFEPETTDGKRPDLLIGSTSEHLLIEVVAPGPQEGAVDPLNARLRAKLERVASGLSVEVSGYNAGPTRAGDPSDLWTAPTNSDIDAIVREFHRKSAQVDPSQLPAPVVERSPGQPVTIIATGFDSRVEGTVVSIRWSVSGSVPSVNRLVNIIRAERRHLPAARPSAILIDLSRWTDFLGPDCYYLQQAQRELSRHRLPETVGSFRWDSEQFHAHPEVIDACRFRMGGHRPRWHFHAGLGMTGCRGEVGSSTSQIEHCQLVEHSPSLENFLYLLNVGNPEARRLLAQLQHDCENGGL